MGGNIGVGCLNSHCCSVGGSHNRERRYSLVLAIGFWFERGGILW